MLHHYKKQVDPDLMTENSASVFDDALYLMNRIIEELIALINETVILEVKAKSRHYRNDRYVSYCSLNIPKLIYPCESVCCAYMLV